MRISSDSYSYEIDLSAPNDISIPLRFNGPQPNLFGVMRAGSEYFEHDGLSGDTRIGGSCNFDRCEVIPHCNGTHTECVGHITHARISVRDCLRDSFLLSALVSVRPERAGESADTYGPEMESADPVLTRRLLADAIESGNGSEADAKALIVRTLPNSEDKLSAVYEDAPPPYFTSEAMDLIVDAGFNHLLVDLPSVDRIYDGGRLSNHRTFWNVGEREFEVAADTRTESTITELIFVPDHLKDGYYLLNLQIAPFEADAAPSRPLLFAVAI